LDERRIFVAGGYGDEEGGFLSTSYIYDASTNEYQPAAPLPIAAATCIVRCGEYVYVLGGEDQKKHRTAECFRILTSELLMRR
jgi:N-acetylneuraminic acid mutarotase